ncbi:hypothetical protein IAU59_007225 [Kwoniella sp. CBS 9459]
MRVGGSPRRFANGIGLVVLSLIVLICLCNIASSPIGKLIREAQLDPNDKWSDFFTPAIAFRESTLHHPSIPRSKPSIFICQHIPYFTPLYRASYATHLLYAEAWGYGYRADRENYMEGDKRKNAVFMNKMYALRKVLMEQLEQHDDERSDWVFMTDADSLISDPAVPLHLLLPPAETVTPTPLILGSQDHNGFNSGVMLFRVDTRVLGYIDSVIETFHAFNEPPPDKAKGWVPSDQVLLAQELVENAELAQHFYQIPRLWINAYWIADAEWDPSTPQLQVHLVNHLKRRVPFAPIVRHNLAILEAANEARARSRADEGDMELVHGYGHGLDLLPQWDSTAEAGSNFWQDARAGIEDMRWLWD